MTFQNGYLQTTYKDDNHNISCARNANNYNERERGSGWNKKHKF